MNLEEMQARCKKAKVTTEDEVWAVSPIYCLLNFHKDDFCKLVDAIGIDKWVNAKERWERLDRAEQELTAKERYIKAKDRLDDIRCERESLEALVSQYEKAIRQS
jgi:hypothetical protein